MKTKFLNSPPSASAVVAAPVNNAGDPRESACPDGFQNRTAAEGGCFTSDGWTEIASGELPEYMAGVNVWCPESENVFCAYYYFFAGSKDPNAIPIWAYFDSLSAISVIKEKVTHWRPLPTPPTGKEPA